MKDKTTIIVATALIAIGSFLLGSYLLKDEETDEETADCVMGFAIGEEEED